jgi:alpha-glucosidase
MSDISRREALARMGVAGSALLFPGIIRGADAAPITIAGKPVEIEVWSVSPITVRITVRPVDTGTPTEIPYTGAIEAMQPATSRARGRDGARVASVRAGELTVRYTESPPTLHVMRGSATVQKLVLDAVAPGMSFELPKGPLLGMGEGGAQYDRKGGTDDMRNGQGGTSTGPKPYRLATHGTRAPVQWVIGTTDGWAMFIHQPYGAFDLTGAQGKFTPGNAGALPLDLFVVSSRDPKAIMREYARITGLPEMPAMWTLGYMQSSRTLAGIEEIIGVARTMREKKLPCSTLIYLGTEFTPSGWNTRNGEFSWHPTNFPDPPANIAALHALNFRVVLHVVIEGRRLLGRVTDACTAPPLPPGRSRNAEGAEQWPPERQVSCYWPAHKPAMDLGVDGFWPDQGDGYDGPSRFNRHRMYWEGQQLYRPDRRPFALHRNASAGIQRFGGFIWSGDVQTRWETLAAHVPIGINTGLSGLPYWGTDIGGFNPTAEYTHELHVRWFQFGSFCPSFRAHGRQWHLRLPWGWDGGDGGPVGDGNWKVAPEELKHPEVEAISRQYLELRSRLMPYLYTAVRETHDTGLPLMRAMWLYHPDDATATANGEQFYWGPDMIVAPVVEKGATSRAVYLPRGVWHDYWTNTRVTGPTVVHRAVDLATTPIYIRAGATIPTGPVKQYVDEPSDEPFTLTVYPGANGTSMLYDDDGNTFAHKRGDFMKIAMEWNDAARRLTLRLVEGRPRGNRTFVVKRADSDARSSAVFEGKPLSISL